MSSNRAVIWSFYIVSFLLLPLMVVLKIIRVVEIVLAKLLWFLGGDTFVQFAKLYKEKV